MSARPIPGYSDYLVNEAGEIILNVDHRQYTANRVIRAHWRNRMYFVGILDDAGERRYVAVRRLVLLAFRGEMPAGTRIVHKDGNPRNHRLANLEYATLKTLLPKQRKGRAKKLCAQDVSEIRRLIADGKVKRRIAAQFGIDPSMITMIANGKRHAQVGIGGQG